MAETIHGEPKLADANTSRSSVKGSGDSGVTAAGKSHLLEFCTEVRGQRKIPDNLALNNIRQYMSYKIGNVYVTTSNTSTFFEFPV